MFVLANMWFQTLMRTFFFNIDKIVFNFISTIYDLLISIARTSVLSQADIADMASRIYKLLAVFMVFKVTFSLIMYVVNPDDFSDKSKGVGKLGTNIVISLGLLILTPYVFSYAYQLQTIILEDNSLAALIFGDEMEIDYFGSAGDTMAYLAMSPFFAPNVSIEELYECSQLTKKESSGSLFNEACSGISNSSYETLSDDESLYALTKNNDDFSEQTLKNYVAGVNKGNLGLTFRLDLAIATNGDKNDPEYIMDYKYLFSTVIGVVIILLLVTYCMDVALRSIKLAFLQLIAPIPIISYVDPKSGKDGLFKKWYKMCFSTYISLFIRLLVIYFAAYIIGRLDEMVDIIDGSYISNGLIKIFVIIGVLMFAKQLPKILEGLGIKLDGDGKFFLNPLKKFEEQAMGGKNITGFARGALMGTAGALTGAGIGRGFSGAWRGLTSGKGWSETGKAEAEMNRKMRQARLDGSTFGGRLGARISSSMGLPSASESVEGRIHEIDEQIKSVDNRIKPVQNSINDRKAYSDKIKAMEDRAMGKIRDGEAGEISAQYKAMVARAEQLQKDYENGKNGVTAEQVAQAQIRAQHYLANEGRDDFIDFTTGKVTEVRRFDEEGNDLGSTFAPVDVSDGAMSGMYDDLLSMVATPQTYTTVDINGVTQTVTIDKATVEAGSAARHSNKGKVDGSISNDTRTYITPASSEKTALEEQKTDLYQQQRTAKANETAIK